ncbi:MAG: CehA/McbA family metallohydrolase [Pseudomonadota bacterium]
MRDPAFAAPGQFWRGNIHTHSTRSDGLLAPSEVCKKYRDAGYDFVALTDHFVGLYDYPITDTGAYRGPDFTTLLGAELHSGAMENGEIWHILAVGLPEDFAPNEAPAWTPLEGQETGPQIAQRARDAGAFVAIAHPEWGGLSLADVRSLEAAHAVEVYNHTCALETDRGQGFWHLDRLLDDGRRMMICATDDAHFKFADAFGGWTMVKAEENNPTALLDALKAGHMYASTGPQIHDAVWQRDRACVKCSPAVTITVHGQASAIHTLHGEGLTDVEVPLAALSESPWLRLTVIDRYGKRAWTNPFWK